MATGVYVITNSVTGAQYIGSSRDIDQRFNAHRHYLRHNTHKNPILQRAWNKYGEVAFMFNTICEVPVDLLLVTEQKWIDSNGDYNIIGATECLGVPWSDERKAEQSARLKENPVWSKADGRPVPAETMAAMRRGMRRRLETHGPNFKGESHTEETKALLRAQSLGNTRCAGREMSESTRAKIGAANSGPKDITEKFLTAARDVQRNVLTSPEVRQRVAQKQVGRKRSDDTVARMANSATVKHQAKVAGLSGVIQTSFIRPSDGSEVFYTLTA